MMGAQAANFVELHTKFETGLNKRAPLNNEDKPAAVPKHTGRPVGFLWALFDIYPMGPRN